MNAPGQLEMFEPDSIDALRLLQSYLKAAEGHLAVADRMDILQCHSAARVATAQASAATESALVLAIYLDLLRLCGEAVPGADA